MTTACDLPIDLSTKSQHHHLNHHLNLSHLSHLQQDHHGQLSAGVGGVDARGDGISSPPHHHFHHSHLALINHHGHPHLASHLNLNLSLSHLAHAQLRHQLDHEQLQQLQLEYLSHQQLSAALANHPLQRLYESQQQQQQQQQTQQQQQQQSVTLQNPSHQQQQQQPQQQALQLRAAVRGRLSPTSSADTSSTNSALAGADAPPSALHPLLAPPPRYAASGLNAANGPQTSPQQQHSLHLLQQHQQLQHQLHLHQQAVAAAAVAANNRSASVASSAASTTSSGGQAGAPIVSGSSALHSVMQLGAQHSHLNLNHHHHHPTLHPHLHGHHHHHHHLDHHHHHHLGHHHNHHHHHQLQDLSASSLHSTGGSSLGATSPTSASSPSASSVSSSTANSELPTASCCSSSSSSSGSSSNGDNSSRNSERGQDDVMCTGPSLNDSDTHNVATRSDIAQANKLTTITDDCMADNPLDVSMSAYNKQQDQQIQNKQVDSPPAHQLSQTHLSSSNSTLSASSLASLAHHHQQDQPTDLSAIDAENPGNPLPIDLHRSSTSSTHSTMSSPPSSSASISSTSSMNVHLNSDKKKINRPLTGKYHARLTTVSPMICQLLTNILELPHYNNNRQARETRHRSQYTDSRNTEEGHSTASATKCQIGLLMLL